jgi:hypothetical protein
MATLWIPEARNRTNCSVYINKPFLVISSALMIFVSLTQHVWCIVEVQTLQLIKQIKHEMLLNSSHTTFYPHHDHIWYHGCNLRYNLHITLLNKYTRYFELTLHPWIGAFIMKFCVGSYSLPLYNFRPQMPLRRSRHELTRSENTPTNQRNRSVSHQCTEWAVKMKTEETEALCIDVPAHATIWPCKGNVDSCVFGF